MHAVGQSFPPGFRAARECFGAKKLLSSRFSCRTPMFLLRSLVYRSVCACSNITYVYEVAWNFVRVGATFLEGTFLRGAKAKTRATIMHLETAIIKHLRISVCIFLQNGYTALAIAKRFGYISVVNTLTTVTTVETTIVTSVCCHVFFSFFL